MTQKFISPRGSGRGPTLKDIAKTLGVSRATVSRALRGVGRMSPALRERILRTSSEMGYKVNYAARALRSRRSNLLGVLVQEHSHYQIGDLLEGIQDEAQKNDYSVLIGTIRHDEDMEIRQIQSMIDKHVDGLLVSPTGTPRGLQLLMDLQRDNIHCVSVLEDLAPGRMSSVSVDELLGGFIATQHLFELNHRHILFFGGYLEDEYFDSRRYVGYCRAHDIYGVAVNPDYRIKCGYTVEEGRRVLLDCIARGLEFSAVFTICDMTAAGAIKGLRDAGLRVPEHVSVVGFDGSNLVSSLFDPELTSVSQTLRIIGQEAFRLVHRKIESKSYDPESIVLSPQLHIGKTTALRKSPL
ncbi:MAG: LacI family DNA-binding transcriptional regulator [Candidatus Sumerlaeota bacterium]|nr:LacI family DNA-binding transcriptional regulator [Candidatus Sumerlaeota bacterium]